MSGLPTPLDLEKNVILNVHHKSLKVNLNLGVEKTGRKKEIRYGKKRGERRRN